MKTAILYGGKSGEHEVSIQSATSVVRNIKREHKVYLIGVSRTGAWHLQPDSVLENCREGDGALELRLDGPAVVVAPGGGLRVYGPRGQADLAVDAVFPVLHGTFGEDGTVQGLLECAGLAYVGADVLGSAVGMDKAVAKALWKQAGLPVVPFIAVDAADAAKLDALADRIEGEFGFPAFVKPVRGGSSVGAAKIDGRGELGAALALALRFDERALIEPFISARELECSVIGDREPTAFPPGELVPSHEFYDYEAKYLDPDGAAFSIPADIPSETAERTMDLAKTAYKTACLAGMARVDFFMDKKTGALMLNEVNTIPGFTSISMFPSMCVSGGLSYPDLIDELLAMAVARKRERAALTYDRRG